MGMATHSRIVAWRIPWTEEPGGLQSKGLEGAEQDQATKHRAQGVHGQPRNPWLLPYMAKETLQMWLG